MRRWIIVIFVLLFLVAIGAGIYLIVTRGGSLIEPQPPSPPPSPGPIPVLPPTPPAPKGDTIDIGTPQGTVTVKNFYRGAFMVINGTNDVVIKRTEGYDIVYLKINSSFLIQISEKPVPQETERAEKDFLEALGVSRVDACKLKVRIGVPLAVDSSYTNFDYGLSFCPGQLTPVGNPSH